jgi:hypothetical protein
MIFLVQLGFHPVAAVGKIVKKHQHTKETIHKTNKIENKHKKQENKHSK